MRREPDDTRERGEPEPGGEVWADQWPPADWTLQPYSDRGLSPAAVIVLEAIRAELRER